jgi:ribosome-binding protein aMBF1 (putative translation factor)
MDGQQQRPGGALDFAALEHDHDQAHLILKAGHHKTPQIADSQSARLATVADLATYKGRADVAPWPPVITKADIAQTIGENIKLGRRLANVTQDELASRIQARDHNEISRYEHARRKPGYDRLIQIAAALGQTVDWMLTPHDDDGAG